MQIKYYLSDLHYAMVDFWNLSRLKIKDLRKEGLCKVRFKLFSPIVEMYFQMYKKITISNQGGCIINF